MVNRLYCYIFGARHSVAGETVLHLAYLFLIKDQFLTSTVMHASEVTKTRWLSDSVLKLSIDDWLQRYREIWNEYR